MWICASLRQDPRFRGDDGYLYFFSISVFYHFPITALLSLANIVIPYFKFSYPILPNIVIPAKAGISYRLVQFTIESNIFIHGDIRGERRACK